MAEKNKVSAPTWEPESNVCFSLPFVTKGSGGRGGNAPRGREKQAIEIKKEKIIKIKKVAYSY